MIDVRKIGSFLLLLGLLGGGTITAADTCPQPTRYDRFSLPVNAAAPGQAPRYDVSGLLNGLSCPTAGCANQVFIPPFNDADLANTTPFPGCAADPWPRNPWGYTIAPGRGYVVQNPIYVDCPLFLHGGSQKHTTLIPADPTQPLFVVRNAGHLQIAGINITAPLLENPGPDGKPIYYPEVVAIRFENTQPVVFEMYDSIVRRSSIEIAGAGTFRIQHGIFDADGHVRAAVLLDHPAADLTMISGDMTNFPHIATPLWPGGFEGPDAPLYHIWQKRGRLQIFGMTVEGAWGNANFRIESRASDELCPGATCPHVIAGVRSEGTNQLDVPYPAALVYVPPTSEAVDVILKANRGSWGTTSGQGLSHFVDYNATGKLWMIGNNSETAVDQLAIGNAPGATVVAIANRLRSKAGFLPIGVGAGRQVFAGNVYSWKNVTGCDLPFLCCNPTARFVNPGLQLTDWSAIPPVPETPIPPPLTRPRLSLAFATQLGACSGGRNPACPGMKIVTASPYKARGDGRTNDTDAIRRAIRDALRDGSLMVYFPAGTYRIDGSLQWLHEDQAAQLDCDADSLFDIPVLPGGWIAGAGSTSTFIVQSNPNESVLLSDGMNTSTVQGLTFRSNAYDPLTDTPDVATVQFEYNIDPNDTAATQIGPATQKNAFHDCVFDGGKFAFGVGLESTWQCDMMNIVSSTLKNAKYGLAVGGYNALSNFVYGSRFENNRFSTGYPIAADALPHDPPSFSPFSYGGSWMIVDSTVTGTAEHDIELTNGGGTAGWYFHGLTTSSPKLHNRTGSTSAAQYLMFDESTFVPTDPTAESVRTDAGGGIIFLHSRANAAMAQKALSARGAISVWSAFDLYRQGGYPLWGGTDFPSDIHRTYVLHGGAGPGDSCGDAVDCDDGLTCTDDVCNGGICENPSTCTQDPFACTIDACVATAANPLGECVHQPHDLLCDDDTACTRQSPWAPTDDCNPSAGCVFNAVDSACCPDCPTTTECDTGPYYPLCPNWAPDRTAQGVCSSGTGSAYTPCLDVADCPQGDSCVPVYECRRASGSRLSCNSHDDDFLGESLFMVECAPECLGCRCDGDEQCDDGLFCNGQETCDDDGACAAGSPPCSGGQICVEACLPPTDLPCEPTFQCLDACPGDWCDGPPSGPLYCLGTDTEVDTCFSAQGAVTGCPEGQTIHAQACDCTGGNGASWYCE